MRTNTLLTLHDPAAARRYHEQGIWRAETFYALAAGHAKSRPHAPAVRDAHRRLSYAELVAWADAAAEDLRARGVRRGQRVSIWLPNCAEALAVFLACSRNGYVCNPSLHQNYTTADVTRLLERLGARAVFARPGYGADAPGEAAFDEIAALPGMAHVYRIGSPSGEAGPAPGFPALVPPSIAPDPNPDKVVYLAFTSGTTGTPKGVMHSDNTLLANACAMVDAWGHDETLVLYSLSPLSHHIAWVAVGQSLYAGGELVVNDVPDGETPLGWILATGATYVMGVPTHAIDVLAEQQRRGLADLGTVRVFYMAGAPIPPEVARAFLDQGVTPQNIYGMTENSSHQYTLPTDDAQTIVSTCGRACVSYEVRIFDAEDRDQPAPLGTVGEIGGRGGCLMLGYFDNQTETEGSFNVDGWFMSGDLGRMDDRGCLEIMGRMKDLIIRGGRNIYPTEIEALAIKHPAVDKVAAIPVPDTRLGEKVCLAISSSGDQPPTGEAMLAHLHAEGLSKYDMPEYFVVMDAFPLTASGKILKRVLADQARAGELAPTPVRWTDPGQS
jgi:acyl-CoA synthetase